MLEHILFRANLFSLEFNCIKNPLQKKALENKIEKNKKRKGRSPREKPGRGPASPAPSHSHPRVASGLAVPAQSAASQVPPPLSFSL